MRRFFINNSEVSPGSTVTVDGDEARHILTVLRMREGDRLILINGSGAEMTAEITSAASGIVTLSESGQDGADNPEMR